MHLISDILLRLYGSFLSECAAWFSLPVSLKQEKGSESTWIHFSWPLFSATNYDSWLPHHLRAITCPDKFSDWWQSYYTSMFPDIFFFLSSCSFHVRKREKKASCSEVFPNINITSHYSLGRIKRSCSLLESFAMLLLHHIVPVSSAHPLTINHSSLFTLVWFDCNGIFCSVFHLFLSSSFFAMFFWQAFTEHLLCVKFCASSWFSSFHFWQS